MKIENRQQVLLVVAATVVGLLVADKVIFGPLIAGWKERSARIVELKKNLAQGALVIQREDTIRSRWCRKRCIIISQIGRG